MSFSSLRRDVSKEKLASMFRTEEYAKKETGTQLAASK
jgi:hypothetical protein